MTVQQAIEKLSKLNPNLDLRVNGEFGGSFGIDDIYPTGSSIYIELNIHDFEDDD